MRNVLLVLFLLVLTNLAATDVPAGGVSGNWSLANSPYRIMGDISINSGQTLSIEPGVVVSFNGFYRLTIRGVIMAQGTLENPITFTVADSTGFYTLGDAGGWQGLYFRSQTVATVSQLRYCNISYVKDESTTRLAGVYAYGYNNLAINNCRIYHNRATGLYCYNSSPAVINCYIHDNQAGDVNGGGCYIFESMPNINNCEISYNYCENYGGGVYIEGDPYPYFKNCKIVNNSCDDRGGALAMLNGASSVLLNCLIANNSATKGGAMFCSSASPIIINNTIINHNAGNQGGAFYLVSADPQLYSCIVWHNTPEQFYLADSDADPLIRYSCIDSGMEHFAGAGATGYSSSLYIHNIDADPLFVNPVNGYGSNFGALAGDYHLGNQSSCIDAGDPSYINPSLTEDLGGDPRFIGECIDQGAYENQVVAADDQVAPAYNRLQVYPNPFKTGTRLNIVSPSATTLIYDLRGRLVTRVNTEQGWRGVDSFGKQCPAGVYFVRSEAQSGAISKVLLMH